MSKIKSVLLVFLVSSISMFVKAQTFSDTTRAACMYVVDSATFTTTTGWLNKITTYEYQFVQQQAPAGVDSFTVKKQKVPVKSEYYFISPFKVIAIKPKQVKVLAEFKL